MVLFKQIRFLLSRAHKKELLILTALLFIGMVLETGGIGVLIPALSFLLNTDINNHPSYSRYFLAIFGHMSLNGMILLGLSALMVFYIFKSIFLVYSAHRQARFANELSVDLSRDLFNGYLRMPYPFHLQRNSSELQRNVQLEILYFGGISFAAISLATELTTIFGISVLLIYVEPFGALTVIIFFGVVSFFLNRITTSNITQLGYKRQEMDGLANKELLEGLGGVKQVKISALEPFFLGKFTNTLRAKAKANTRIQTLAAIPRLYLEFLAIVGVSLIIIIMISEGKPLYKLIPVLGIFMAAAFRLIPSINKIINSMQTINFSKPVVQVLTKEFEMIRSLPPETDDAKPLVFENEITVQHLDFSYEDLTKKALTDISVTIRKGEFVGFIGSTGSGKSTLIDTIIGLLKPQRGGIFIDGRSIEENIHHWQSMIGYVPQLIFLTDDTLRRNIAFGIPDADIDEEKVKRAINTAQLSSFVERLTDGLETIVGERGVRLSGGERQRIGIARALYNDPPVLILDEATSALDMVTEKEFMESVNSLQGIKTILIIAHRLSTVERCDRVYELQHGVIVKT